MIDFDTGFAAAPAAMRRARLAASLRTDLDRLQTETVTGRAADPARALGGLTREAAALAARREAVEAYAAAADLAAGREAARQTTLATLRESAGTMANEAVAALAGNAADTRAAVGAGAEAAFGAAVSALSARFGPVSLFAGDATDRPALAEAGTILADARAAAMAAGGGAAGDAALRAIFDDPTGLFATSHYTGGDGPAPGVAVDEGVVLGGGMRADDAPLRAVLRELAALAVAADPAVTPDRAERRSLIAAAAEGLRATLDPLAGLAAGLGAVEAAIEEAGARHEAEATALDLALDAMTGRDPYEAASALTATEDALEALFASTARLSSLSLTAFLR